MTPTRKLAKEIKDRNYSCNFCDFRAVYSSGLKRHISEFSKTSRNHVGLNSYPYFKATNYGKQTPVVSECLTQEIECERDEYKRFKRVHGIRILII